MSDMKKSITLKKLIAIALILLFVLLTVVTAISLNSGKQVTKTYKITYGNKTNVSEDEAVGYDNDYSFGVMSTKSSIALDSADVNSLYAESLETASYESSDISNSSDLELADLKVDGDYLKWTYDTLVETTEYDKLVSDLANIVKDADDYVESSEELKNEYRNNAFTETYDVRRGIYTIRIPDKDVNLLTEALSSSDIKSSNSFCEDLTTSYIDTETKLSNLQKEYDKLQSLALDASDIQDILAINDRITSIEQELDYYNKLMEQLNKDVQYATYNITIDEVKYYDDTIVEYSSSILQNWGDIATEWLSEVIPIAFFFFITIIPFVLCIACIVYRVSKKKIDYTFQKKAELENKEK